MFVHGICLFYNNFFPQKRKLLSSKYCLGAHFVYISFSVGIIGSANGNRTRDFALRGRRLNRLTIAPFLAPGLGLEPRLNDPESLVLPLHHPGVAVL